MLRRFPRWTRATAAVVAGSSVIAGCASTASGTAAVPPGSVTVHVGLTGCGTGWQAPRAGAQDFTLDNRDLHDAAVQLIDPRSAAIYAEVEPLGSNSAAHLRITLGAGDYAFRCVLEDDNTVTGPTVHVPDTAGITVAAPPVAAVSQSDLVPYAQRYAAYVRGRLPALTAQVTALQRAIATDDLTAARTAWRAAHLTYEELGAAYGAFGPADAAINGTADGLAGGVHDPGFTGFHRLEYGLWHGAPAAALDGPAHALSDAVRGLSARLAQTQLDPAQVSIRAHEITENAIEFELTGRSDYGSHSNLATVAANLGGTGTVLRILRPLLVARYRALPRLDTALSRTNAVLAATRTAGNYPPLAALSRSQREAIDSACGELAELLAPVATILEPRRTSS